MLSIGGMGSGQAGYYLGLAREDYYLQGGEPPGVWQGHGARSLGLSGTVNGEELHRLFAGRHPREDLSLVQIQEDREHRPGWDLTFSAPKSVSALWSQADGDTRRIIQEAHFAAVKSALSYLEDTAEVARRGKGGHEHETASLVIATFEHGTSRAQDPQIHTHCLVMNLCLRSDGVYRTLDGKPLYDFKMTAGALYRAEFASQLEEGLHLSTERRGSCFEIGGVSQDLITEFSKRRGEIMTALEEKGYDSAAAAATATMTTRQTKTHTPREELFRQWQETGEERGWGPEEAALFLKESKTPIRNEETEKRECISEAVGRATAQQSYFTERDFIRYVAEEAQGRGIGAAAVQAIGIAHLEGSQEIVSLGEHKGSAIYTTREMMELEKKLLSRVEDSRAEHSAGVSAVVLDGVLASRSKLNEEQAAALRHICSEGEGSIRVVSGMAGTGKTTMLDAARFAWEVDGFEVHGAAVAGKAAKGLSEGALIKSDTLHQTLWNIERGVLRLHEKSVVVVDEAGMIGTRQMERLVEATETAGARLVLVGDKRQLQPIDAGGPLEEIEQRVGAAELTTILRQRDQWARDAVHDFAGGRADEALGQYADRGLLSVSEDRRGAYGELIAAWKVEGVRAPEEQLIFTGTRLDAAVLNRMAQEERKKEGELGQGSVTPPSGGDTFHCGDRVLFTKRSRLYGVENGSMGEVVAVDPEQKTLSARLDNGDRVSVSLEDFPHVRLGYAATTHKGQGVTVERSFVLVGGSMQDRESTYVQASRARGDTQIFADRETAGDDIYRLVRQMSESRPKEMAHTVQQRASQQQTP